MVCTCICVYMCDMYKANFSSVSFSHEGSRDSTQVMRGSGKHPDSLSHLTGPTSFCS